MVNKKKIVLMLLVLVSIFLVGRSLILTKKGEETPTQKTQNEPSSFKKIATYVGVLSEAEPEEPSFWNEKWGIGLFVVLLGLGIFFVLAPVYVFLLNLLGLHAFIFTNTSISSGFFLSFCFLMVYFSFNYIYPIDGEKSEDGRPKKPNFHQKHAKKLKVIFSIILILNVMYFARTAYFEHKIIQDFKPNSFFEYISYFLQLNQINHNSCFQNKYEEVFFKHVFAFPSDDYVEGINDMIWAKIPLLNDNDSVYVYYSSTEPVELSDVESITGSDLP